MLLSQARTDRSLLSEWWRSIDRFQLGLFIALILSGIILSMAASPAAAEKMEKGQPFYFLYRHVFFAFLGLSGAFIVSLMNVRTARRAGVLCLIGAIAVLSVLPAIGFEVKGAQRWMSIGPFSLQPSEFAKPGFIVFAAWMFSVRKKSPEFPGVFILFVVYALLVFFLIRQPDFGQSFLLTACFGAVFFYAGLGLGWLMILGGITLAGSLGVYTLMPHVRDRVDRFLNPEGSDTYQTDMALQAISNGGIFGRGPGEGAVKYKLPDGHTDFIFAVFMQQFGLLGAAVLILLYLLIIWRCFQITLKAQESFSRLLAGSLTITFFFSFFINMCMVSGLLPVVGLPLPLISYGGTSMVTMLANFGILMSIHQHRKLIST